MSVSPPELPPRSNAEIAARLDEIADLLDIQSANPFRVRAYRQAARTVGGWGCSVQALVAQHEDLDALPGVGPDLAGKIGEIANRGSCALLDQLHRQLPRELVELLSLPGLGPRRVGALHSQLGVDTVEQLHAAAQQGRVHGLHGFGPRLEHELLELSAARLRSPTRFTRAFAEQVAEAMLAELRALPGVECAVAAGSLRRQRDTVGDLDLLVTLRGPGDDLLPHFVQRSGVQRVLAAGATRASVVLDNGLQVDLRAVPAESFGAAWLYFTGSKAHNIVLRRMAQAQDLKLNEYGLFRGEQRIAGESEESVYRALGLPFIEPALREARGEIEAARAGRLPRPLQRSDLRGDLHVHTRDSDGRDTLERMAEAARAQGLEYIAITDHSRRLSVARGLDVRRLAEQIERIDRLNEGLRGFTVLKGIEVDILEDGALDLPQSILERLDLVIGAVHHRLDLSRAQQTARILRAMDSPCFSILAHPTGRLLGEREPSPIDLLRVLRHARERGCFIELNAQPERLDLDDQGCRLAKEEGVLVALNSDAHDANGYQQLRLGVGQAARGWLEAADVLNTRGLGVLRPLLAHTMSRPAAIAPPARALALAQAGSHASS